MATSTTTDKYGFVKLSLTKEKLDDYVKKYIARAKGSVILKAYPRAKVGHWKIEWGYDSSFLPAIVYGSYESAVRFMVSRSAYFGSWVPSTDDQVQNCNNGHVTLQKIIKL